MSSEAFRRRFDRPPPGEPIGNGDAGSNGGQDHETITGRALSDAEWREEIGELASEVAHQVRNPLSAILGYLAVARRSDGERDGGEWVEGIRHEVDRIDEVVQNLSELASQARRMVCDVDLNEELRLVCRDLARGPDGPLSGVDFELDLDEAAAQIRTAPSQLECALEKVLLEAAEAGCGDERSPRCHVTVGTWPDEDAPEERVRIAITASTDGAEEDGIGRDGATGLDLSARPGSDGGPSRSAGGPLASDGGPPDGRGLVLALTRHSVRKLGGTIEVQEIAGSGARFDVTLPVAGPDETADESIEDETSSAERSFETEETTS